MDIFRIKSKLRGYFKMERSVVLGLFVGDKRITLYQFALLMIYVCCAGWDERHADYAIADISDRELSNVVGLKKDKVGHNRRILEAKGHIALLKGKNRQYRIRIKHPDLFFIKKTGKVSGNEPTVSEYGDTQQV